MLSKIHNLSPLYTFSFTTKTRRRTTTTTRFLSMIAPSQKDKKKKKSFYDHESRLYSSRVYTRGKPGRNRNIVVQCIYALSQNRAGCCDLLESQKISVSWIIHTHNISQLVRLYLFPTLNPVVSFSSLSHAASATTIILGPT